MKVIFSHAISAFSSEAASRLRQLQAKRNTLWGRTAILPELSQNGRQMLISGSRSRRGLPDHAVQQAPSASQGPTNLQPHLTTVNLHRQDAELIGNYSNSTCFTITDDALLFAIWQVTIPDIALSSFLRHGLLALSAVHLRLTSPPGKKPLYTELARQHQGEALKSYIPHLQMITEASCPALFAFSTILSALSYSFLQSVESDLPGEEYITRFLEIWNFLLGATVVATESKCWIRQSILSPLLRLRSLEDVLPYLDADPQVALQGLLDYISIHAPS